MLRKAVHNSSRGSSPGGPCERDHQVAWLHDCPAFSFSQFSQLKPVLAVPDQSGPGQRGTADGTDQASGANLAADDGADAAVCLPLPWQNYFDRQLSVACPSRGATFNVYQAGDSGPVVLCLHGGGYTGLSWALFAQQLKDRQASHAG